MIYCDYGALSKEDRKTLAQKIYDQLKPNDKFLLDVFSITKYNHEKEQQVWDYSDKNGFWSDQPYLSLSRSVKYHDKVILEQIQIITEEKLTVYHLWTTYFTVKALAAELLNVGFKNYKVFNDVKGTPYDGKGYTLTFILEK
jgi:hypothetical protein